MLFFRFSKIFTTAGDFTAHFKSSFGSLTLVVSSSVRGVIFTNFEQFLNWTTTKIVNAGNNRYLTAC